ncbi:hypothetical protein [Streptomyces sp. NPDC050988]|uniref:hypothetical protein n=1 Tax=Streptomyces sp. NPDC050988 TaxID=3365637 RepID=UPI0037B9328D
MSRSSGEGRGRSDTDRRAAGARQQIRGLLDAGLPTRIIKQILPCLDGPGTIHFPDPTPEMLTTLEIELDRMTRRIDCLARNRDAIAAYLEVVRGDGRSVDDGRPSVDV